MKKEGLKALGDSQLKGVSGGGKALENFKDVMSSPFIISAALVSSLIVVAVVTNKICKKVYEKREMADNNQVLVDGVEQANVESKVFNDDVEYFKQGEAGESQQLI